MARVVVMETERRRKYQIWNCLQLEPPPNCSISHLPISGSITIIDSFAQSKNLDSGWSGIMVKSITLEPAERFWAQKPSSLTSQCGLGQVT